MLGTIYNVQRMVKGICTIAASVVLLYRLFWIMEGDLFLPSGLASPADAASSGWSIGVYLCSLNRRQTEREMQFYKGIHGGKPEFCFTILENARNINMGRRFVFMEKKSFFWKD